MIAIDGLRKRFGAIDAVREVSLRAENGTVTGLLGPNGAGKTTTLRMLSGLMRPDAGRIRSTMWMWSPIRLARSITWACSRIGAGCIRD